MLNRYQNHPWFGEDIEDDKEKLENFYINEDYGKNTRCKILYNRGNNIHFIYIPVKAAKIFADYETLKQSLPIYWVIEHGKAYLSLKEPTFGVYYKTRAQVANITTGPRYKITIPKKIKTEFQIQTHCIMNLIQEEKGIYLCTFEHRTINNE